ncbi:hypothetical protein SESBI_09421 [Sesbania bispinosa]|nr:hypothetical protein SESBI_09421 [Sesbania bispinosa]
MILTYGAKYVDSCMVSDEHFVIGIPDSLPLDVAASLLCARITLYNLLRYFGIDKLDPYVGVVTLGGLGHMGVKFAKALGAKVTMISTSPNKKKEAIEQLGVDLFVVSYEQDQMQAAMGTLHGAKQRDEIYNF